MTETTYGADVLIPVQVTVNGVGCSASVPARRLLSDFLRHDLRLTGTHVGCEHGVCGACTVLLDGRPVRTPGRAHTGGSGKSLNRNTTHHASRRHPCRISRTVS